MEVPICDMKATNLYSGGPSVRGIEDSLLGIAPSVAAVMSSPNFENRIILITDLIHTIKIAVQLGFQSQLQVVTALPMSSG